MNKNISAFIPGPVQDKPKKGFQIPNLSPQDVRTLEMKSKISSSGPTTLLERMEQDLVLMKANPHVYTEKQIAGLESNIAHFKNRPK
jgi:hypothetical protein